MIDRGGCHKKFDIEAIDQNVMGDVFRLKALIKDLLSEINSLNAIRPDSVPRRYFQYYESMSTKLDRVDRPTDTNACQLKLWTAEIRKMGDAVMGYLNLDVKVRPQPPGLTVVDGGKR